ncbi:MAG: aminodeoxychorismate/anthranilate synthase component II [Spartobacteria bacterium]|nr:aminodeoxychorismate/anthranilate synthase component II [Spartobacteria bacterium]
MILFIDNYDSFTYNLVQYVGELDTNIQVVRNDVCTLEELTALKPDKLIISPGPCTPKEAGVSCEAIRHFGPSIPTLGVCLGHQCIGDAFGGRVIRADQLMHGKTSPIRHEGRDLFKGMPNPFQATRYHSLIVERASLPDELTITAETEKGEIMGLRHKSFPVYGVQFHPESILTEEGKRLIRNFLSF